MVYFHCAHISIGVYMFGVISAPRQHLSTLTQLIRGKGGDEGNDKAQIKFHEIPNHKMNYEC